MSTMWDANRLARNSQRSPSLAGQLTALMTRYRARRAFRRNCVELASLSDRTLRDIGVTRGEIRGLVAEISRTGDGRAGRTWKV